MQYSTVPPWLPREAKPLIDALTGVPGGLFPTHGSEVVTLTAGVQKPFSKRLPLWESYRERVSPSQPLSSKNLAHFFWKVNPPQGKNRGRKGKSLVETGRLGGHKSKVTDFYKRLHNATAYVNICNLLTQHIAKSDDLRPISCMVVDIIYA